MGFVEARIRSNNYIQPLLMSLFLTLKFSSYLFYSLSDLYCLLIALWYCFFNIVSSNIEYYYSNKITGFIEEILAIILWALLMYMILAVIVFILQIPPSISIYLLLIIVILGIYGYANAHHLIVKEKVLKLDNLENELNIVHISDVHIGAIRRKSLAKKLANKLKEINPDIAFISGDLADGYASLKEDTFEDFKNLDFPVVFTPGNHDLYQGLDNIKRIATKGGITILDNEAMKFKGLNIHGLGFRQDPDSFLDIPNWEMMWNINKEENNLIIFHFPYYWNELLFSDSFSPSFSFPFILKLFLCNPPAFPSSFLFSSIFFF